MNVPDEIKRGRPSSIRLRLILEVGEQLNLFNFVKMPPPQVLRLRSGGSGAIFSRQGEPIQFACRFYSVQFRSGGLDPIKLYQSEYILFATQHMNFTPVQNGRLALKNGGACVSVRFIKTTRGWGSGMDSHTCNFVYVQKGMLRIKHTSSGPRVELFK